MNASKPFPADGSPLSCTAGSHTINLIPTVDGGYTLKVTAGTHEYTELAQSFSDETMARAVARTLAAGLIAGVSIWQFIADRQAADRDLIAAVNASMDQAEAAYLAPRVQARRIAAEVMGNAGLNRYAHGTPNQRTRHLPLSAMGEVHRRALLAANQAGEIHVGPGVAATTLWILHEAGYGRVVAGERRHSIAKLQLNERGLQAARQIGASA